MKHILPKSGANLVQFSGRSECPLLKWSHMQYSIDGLESLFFFLHVKKLFTKLKHPRDQSIGCVGTNLLSRCRCRLKLPLCKVQNLCAEFNRDFCKRLHLRRKWEKWGWEKNSSSNLQSCKCISIKVTPDQTEIDRVLTSKAPVLPQGTCVRSLVHTIVCSHTWDSKVASSIGICMS